MAFSVASPGSAGGTSTGGGQVQLGPELEEIQTDVREQTLLRCTASRIS